MILLKHLTTLFSSAVGVGVWWFIFSLFGLNISASTVIICIWIAYTLNLIF